MTQRLTSLHGHLTRRNQRGSLLTRPLYVLLSPWLVVSGALLIVQPHARAHRIGEPALEQLLIWKQCCNEHDCVPQSVNIIRKEENALRVDIAGSQTSIDTYKFSPVPSTRTWVCYVVPNGVVTNDNIRCILHPQQSGTT